MLRLIHYLFIRRQIDFLKAGRDLGLIEPRLCSFQKRNFTGVQLSFTQMELRLYPNAWGVDIHWVQMSAEMYLCHCHLNSIVICQKTGYNIVNCEKIFKNGKYLLKTGN